MISEKQKAIESVVKRLVDEVDKEFEKGKNPYDYESRIVRVMNNRE